MDARKHRLLFLFLIFSTHSAVAGLGEWFEEVEPVIGIHGGEAIAVNTSISNQYTVGDTLYDYDGDGESQVRGVFGGFAGLEFEFTDNLLWQSAISYYQTTPFTSEGDLVQKPSGVSPSHYDYSFKVVTHQFLWENKFLLTEWRKSLHPYVSFGLGLSYNKTKDYENNVPTSFPFLTFTPEYEDNTETSFSYSVGLGLDYDICDDFRLGLGYRFTDLGRFSTGDAKLDTLTVNHALERDELYSQEIILQLTYVL